MKREPTCTYGFLVRQSIFAEGKAVEIRILRRLPGESSPVNCPGDGESRYDRSPRRLQGLNLSDLQIIVWNSGAGTPRAYVSAPKIWYRDAYLVDEKRAAQMARTLKRLNIAIEKARATEIGQVILVIAEAIGAKWHAIPDGHYSFYRDTQWQFSSVDSAVLTARSIASTFDVARGEAA